ncbi:hypothetical protein [Accumulibacter sp.]|uniref:hypothetical protein n=1 Tax=Accumulibacter sp. TaxID=2053492 RepID=UPI00262030BB|nr:hypothetical protein [Accumulibacter sp.]
MRNAHYILLVAAAAAAGYSWAQQYPVLDMIADRVVQKYEQSSCQQLWEQKSQPTPAREQEILQKLRDDPAMRTEFINRVAAPIVNKMFECGMIP